MLSCVIFSRILYIVHLMNNKKNIDETLEDDLIKKHYKENGDKN